MLDEWDLRNLLKKIIKFREYFAEKFKEFGWEFSKI